MIRDAAKLERLLDRGISASELISELGKLPPNSKVGFISNYGDRGQTQQLFIVENVQPLKGSGFEVSDSSYSESGFQIREIDEEDEDTEDADGEEVSETVNLAVLNLQ